MTLRYYPNTKATAMAGTVTPSATDLYVVDGGTYPDPTSPGEGQYKIIVGYGSDREEVCIVTAKPAANTLRVTRGQAGTTASSKNIGDVVVHGVNAAEFADAADHMAATTGVHGVVGALAPAVHEHAQADVTGLVSALVIAAPVGSGMEWYAAVAPTGWLLCDGSAVSRTTYAALFAVLGTTWGAGNGSTTFNLPDRRARVGVGYKGGDSDHGTLAGTGGSKTSVAPHTHPIDHDHPSVTSGAESATHYHGVGAGPSAYAVNGSYAVGADPNLQVGALSINTGTESATHTHPVDLPAFSGTSGAASAAATSGNLQPFVTINYIIRAL